MGVSSSVFHKDEASVLDYAVDWEDWLCNEETILTSTWDVPEGITKDSDSKTDTIATVWLSGGTTGETYELVNHITTSGARTVERTITIHVRER